MNMNIATTSVPSSTDATQIIELGMAPAFCKITNLATLASQTYNKYDATNTAGVLVYGGATAAVGTSVASAGLSLFAGSVATAKGIVIGTASPLLNSSKDALMVEWGFYDE